jgi:hypothetical protein
MRAMLEQTSMKRRKAGSRQYFRLNMIVLLACFIGGCAADDTDIDDSDLCYEQYIEEFGDQYPIETLKKTAALKCYS